MLERCRIFEVTERQDAVALGTLLLLGRRRARDRRCERTSPECERMASPHLPTVSHVRVPVWKAFSASHHHTVGNADAPPFCSGSRRLNRSERAGRLLCEVNRGVTYWHHNSTRSNARAAATSAVRSFVKICRHTPGSTAGC